MDTTSIKLVDSMYVERSGKQFSQFGKIFNVEECIDVLFNKPKHTYYEYISSNAITKLYLDKDICIHMTEDTNLPAMKALHMAQVVQKLDEIKKHLLKISPHVYYKIASRHGYKEGTEDDNQMIYKISFRPYFSGVRFVYNTIPRFLEWVQQEDFWDMSVYTKERLLGAIYGFKDKFAKRQLKPEVGEDCLKSYIAQYVEHDWPLVDFVLYTTSGILSTDDAAAALANEEEDDDEDDNEHTHSHLIADLLSDDPLLNEFLHTQGKLSFRMVTHQPEFDSTQLYIHKKCGVRCPIAKRVHKSNNASLNVRGGKVYYHCFDQDDCGHHPSLDISHAVQNLKHIINVSSTYTEHTAVSLDEEQTVTNNLFQDEVAPLSPTQNVKKNKTHQCPENEHNFITNLSSRINIPSFTITHAMKARWPGRFDHLRNENFIVSQCSDLQLSFNWGDVSGYITRNSSVLDADGAFVGMIVPDHIVNGPFTHIHKDIPVQINECIYNQVDACNSVLVSNVPNVDMTIKLYNISNCKTALVQSSGKKDVIITNEKKIRDLQLMIANASDVHVEKGLGCPLNRIFQVNIINNGGNIIFGNNTTRNDDGYMDTDPENIVRIALDNHEAVFDRLRYVPELKSNNCNGIYLCDPDTNIWKRKTNPEMEQLVINTLRPDSNFSMSQIKYLSSRRGRADILYCISCKKIDPMFKSKLDSHTHIFPCENGLFDMSLMGFRPIQMKDFVKQTSGWSYDPDMSKKYMGDVQLYLQRLFPVEEERRVVLTYVASLLCGDRKLKKFVVLTDRRAGNNGKSTFISFLKRLFGDFAAENGKKVLNKSTFEAGRNAHDGGIEQLKGLRLIVADEYTRDDRLDTGFLKWLTSGTSFNMEGRAFNSDDKFKFVFQAGIVLAFNEGQCPKFDADDEAFVKRILVVPMRSLFVNNTNLMDEPFTFPIDINIENSFELWTSAFADMLLQHYTTSWNTLHIPESMNEWQSDLTMSNNPLMEFFETSFEVTGDKEDVIIRDDVYKTYMCDNHQNDPSITKKIFDRLFKAYFTKVNNVKYVEKSDVNGARNVRGVVRGVKGLQQHCSILASTDDISF